jgi:hypothetical protein
LIESENLDPRDAVPLHRRQQQFATAGVLDQVISRLGDDQGQFAGFGFAES